MIYVDIEYEPLVESLTSSASTKEEAMQAGGI